jgi:Raf kinase inhibitor-like YbhB/YbcL family protein
MTSRVLALALGTATVAAGLATQAQQNELTDVTVVGHVYEPRLLRATDARVSRLTVPTGFRIQRFAEGLDNPRMIQVAPDGTVYVTQREPGSLAMLRDVDGDGVADVQRTVLSDMPWLHGLEIDNATIYLADVHNVYRGLLHPDGGIVNLRRIEYRLPDAGQHPNRTLAIGPDQGLYVTVGSTCNACEEPDPRNAAMLRIEANGTGRPAIYARGLRNTVGFGWHPLSRRLWAMDHGIDWLGDERQGEELNEIEQGALYGWPFLYDDQERNPQDEPTKVTWSEWTKMSTPPVALNTPHSAPMQLVFYEGTQLPPEYHANAFLANRGSWNRKPPSGYDVQRLVFTPAGEFERFETLVGGFLRELPDGSHGIFGRPTGLAVDSTGALLVGDDTNNVIYRLSYGDPGAAPPAQLLASEIFGAAPPRIAVSSTAFDDGGPIPVRYTDYGAGVSPPLAWEGVPESARSLVLLVEDPDAPSPLPFVHWIAANIDPALPGLAEGPERAPNAAPADEIADPSNPAEIPTEPDTPRTDLQEGSNSKTLERYFGPRPPEGDAPHSYHFQVFALDRRLTLPPGFNRNALLKAMEGHVIARGAYVGTFAREP